METLNPLAVTPFITYFLFPTTCFKSLKWTGTRSGKKRGRLGGREKGEKKPIKEASKSGRIWSCWQRESLGGHDHLTKGAHGPSLLLWGILKGQGLL
jgi:hypothetical protein